MDLIVKRLWLMQLFFGVAEAVIRPSAITISDNGYSGILVALDPSVSEDLDLLDDIKTMFTDASAYLHEATEKRAYFRDVTILVPNSWSSNPSWKPAASELYHNADVIVQNPRPLTKRARYNGHRDTMASIKRPVTRAYTRTFGGCGQPGVRINLFTDIFGSRNPYGPPGRVLVHEWARFRWGVFNEYAIEGEVQFYFSPTTGQMEPIRCNINIKGRIFRKDPVTGRGSICSAIDNRTGIYQEGCMFNPYVFGHFNDHVTASIMDRPQVKSITHFCTDDYRDPNRVHNFEAPSQHNRICGGLSTLTVILQSQDFQGNANTPRDVSDTTPTFQVVHQAQNRRLVMAIDTSSSMQADDKLTRARQAASSLINDALDDEEQVGVVTFSDQAVLASPVQRVGDEKDRKKISRTLPKKASGITSIGCALLKSIEALEQHDPNASDAFIVVLTDGRDTTRPGVTDVMDKIRSSGAVINIIALSGQADPNLYHLATKTGGRYYIDNAETVSTSAMDAMLDVYSVFDSGQGRQPVQVMSRSQTLGPAMTIKGSFFIDHSLGRNTEMIVTFDIHIPHVTLTSPTGRLYSSIYPEYRMDADLKRIKFSITGLSETGHWTFQLTNRGNRDMGVAVLVISHGRDPTVEPLRLTGGVLTNNGTCVHSRIVAEVKRGGVPVKHAKVMATVFRPVGSPITLELLDSGMGADIMKGDGLYSRYFVKFNADGFYSVKIEVTRIDHRKGVKEPGGTNTPNSVACINAGSAYYVSKSKVKNKRGSVSRASVDVHPPVRITDLRVLHTNQSAGKVVLAWTAPGDDLDHDKAAFYTVMLTETATEMLRSKRKRFKVSPDWVVDGTLLNPKPFGNREEITVKIPSMSGGNQSFTFAIYAVDKVGNKGELSNLVTAGFGFVPDFSDPEYLNQSHEQAGNPKEVPRGTEDMITIVVGTFSSLLALAVAGTLLTCGISALRRRCSSEFADTKDLQKNRII